MDINKIIRATGLSKSETVFLERIKQINQNYPAMAEAILIGSSACKLYSTPNYKGRISQITDIDFVLKELPDEMKNYLELEHLINSMTIRTGMLGTKKRIKESKFTVYKLKDEYCEIDIFERDIANIKIPCKLKHNTINIEEVEIKIANAGLILATQLNPNAYNTRRDNRVRFMVDSIGNNSLIGTNYEGAIMDCIEVFDNSEVTQEDFTKVKNEVNNKGKGISQKYVNLVNDIYEGLHA